jgi:DNA invertase Pin-like site-specific DNA recombinase
LGPPGFLRLIAMAKVRKIGAVVIYKLERLFRTADIAAQLHAIFDSSNVRVLSCDEKDE